MKLLGVVPSVTFMGGWSNIPDGIVYGLHFYQKTIHLMFIHACLCVISEFDQGLFVGGVSDSTHVHLERILFEVTPIFHQGCQSCQSHHGQTFFPHRSLHHAHSHDE